MELCKGSLVYLTGFAKTWLKKSLSYTFTDTFYSFNLHRTFTGYAAVDRQSWFSHWLLAYPSIQPKFRPVPRGKVVHLQRWTSYFETFPVRPNRSIEFRTEISRNFGWIDRALCLLFNRWFTSRFLNNWPWESRKVPMRRFMWRKRKFHREMMFRPC